MLCCLVLSAAFSLSPVKPLSLTLSWNLPPPRLPFIIPQETFLKYYNDLPLICFCFHA